MARSAMFYFMEMVIMSCLGSLQPRVKLGTLVLVSEGMARHGFLTFVIDDPLSLQTARGG